MKTKAHINQALVNIWAAKMRSFLALLGILVGTAAVVALISCGEMATEKALAQFKALGTNLMAVSLFNKSGTQSAAQARAISLQDWRQLPLQHPNIRSIAPYATTYQSISFHGQTLQGPIIGADESLAQIINIRIARGHFLSHVDTTEHFAVIGSGLADKIGHVSLDNPVGQQLNIGQALYTIIGVAKPWQENAFFNEDINQAVLIPIAGIGLINKNSQVNSAVILLKKDTAIDPFLQQLRQSLELKAQGMNVFLRSAKQIIASMESQGHIFTLLLGVIGGISLLVGGIGVMNVMLVAVTERKKEIGVRKAVGAKNSEIQTLFLIESIIIAFLGGALGVIMGLLCSGLIAKFSHWPFFISLYAPVGGFVVSVATGIFFGFYPARRAAKLTAVASLRGD